MSQSTALSKVPSAYRQPAFIGAAVVLLLAAVGLNGAVGAFKLYFKKEAVPPARALTEIPKEMGDWIQVSRDEPLDHDMQEVLGTDRYIFRDYLDIPSHGGECASRLIELLHDSDPAGRAGTLRGDYLAATPEQRLTMLHHELDDLSITNLQRKKALAQVQSYYPDAVINMAVTYYTGLVDTVAHIPDRCYIADGFEPKVYEEPSGWLPDSPDTRVRFINFEDNSGAGRISRSVAYFFHVNGDYAGDPLGVRLRLQRLTERYGYYAKVELMTLDPDHDRSAQTMKRFLASALVEVKKTFPDWKKVTGGQ